MQQMEISHLHELLVCWSSLWEHEGKDAESQQCFSGFWKFAWMKLQYQCSELMTFFVLERLVLLFLLHSKVLARMIYHSRADGALYKFS